jgi:hypothetical protein
MGLSSWCTRWSNTTSSTSCGKKHMRFVDTRTIGNALVFLAYQPVRDA